MTSPSPAERNLFADLARLLMSMQSASHGEVEASIEARFREFVRSRAAPDVGGLQITFTWTLPEGADDWAIYRTDYRTLPVEPVLTERVAAAGGGSAAVLDFPARPNGRAAAGGGGDARILPFRSRRG